MTFLTHYSAKASLRVQYSIIATFHGRGYTKNYYNILNFNQ